MKRTFFPSFASFIFCCLFSLHSGASVMTVQGTNSAVTGNCIPFGCPGAYGPHEGFVYKNLTAFSLNAGDIIAFDTNGINDAPISFNISLATTSVNGGSTAASSFLTVVSNGTSAAQFGDTITGNYDLAFTVTSAFNFSGGGLIIDFNPTGASTSDTSWVGNLVGTSSSDPTNLFVNRYYGAPSAGSGGRTDTSSIGNFRITNNAAIPEPSTLALLGLGLLGFMFARKRKQV